MKGKLNGVQVVVAIVKCVVGTGSFFLPQGIAQAGLWGGVVGLVLMAVVTVYLNYIILGAKFKYRSDNYQELCFSTLGPIAGWSMFCSVVITNVGSCSVYLVTGSQLLLKVSDAIPQQAYIVMIAGVELLISWLPSFKTLAFTSVFGIIGLLIAMFTVLVYGFTEVGIQPLSSYPAVVLDTYGIFFATAAFLYIQPSTFFPIANEAERPERFNFYNTLAYLIIATINTIFASIAYLFFGSNTQSLVLENICPNVVCHSAYTTVAQVALFVDVLFTFPLILAPAHEVIEGALFVTEEDQSQIVDNNNNNNIMPLRNPSSGFMSFSSLRMRLSRNPMSSSKSTKCPYMLEYSLFRRNFLRTLTMGFTYAFAALIPNISALVGIVSGVTLTYNSFIMGSIIHIKIRSKEVVLSSLMWYFDLTFHVFLFLLGFMLGVWSVYLAVLSLINPSSS